MGFAGKNVATAKYYKKKYKDLYINYCLTFGHFL